MSTKILIVDDSLAMRGIVMRSLRQAGYGDGLLQAGGLTEAIEQLAAGDIALIVSKFRFLDGSAIDLIKKVRSTPAYRSLPALLLSNGVTDAEVASALAAGFQGCLKDLTNIDDVRAMVSQFID